MNMMQNLPFLVAQASPAKNAITTKQPNAKAEKSEEGQTFKQVLSKQLEQDESKKTLEQSSHDKHKTTDNKTASAVGDNNAIQESSVDAQLLASTVTAKAVNEATDGVVVLDVPISDTPIAIAVQTADAAPTLMANMSQMLQPNQRVEQTAVDIEDRVDDVLAKAKLIQDSVHIEPHKAMSFKEMPANARVAVEMPAKDEVTTIEGNQAGATTNLEEIDQAANTKFSNYLAGEKGVPTAKEMPVTPTVSNSIDAGVLSTMTMQAAGKSFAPPMPATEQAGLSHLINVAPGKPGWSEAIGQKVVWMVGAAEQSATLTLNPKDLGPLQVIIQVNNEKADATFISENPEVRKALEEGMSGLRQAMGQAGVELGQANVNTGKQHQEFQQASKEYSARKGQENSATLGAESMQNTSINTRVSHGLVDTFV
jgi:flagellar hook-length control protein FliK